MYQSQKCIPRKFPFVKLPPQMPKPKERRKVPPVLCQSWQFTTQPYDSELVLYSMKYGSWSKWWCFLQDDQVTGYDDAPVRVQHAALHDTIPQLKETKSQEEAFRRVFSQKSWRLDDSSLDSNVHETASPECIGNVQPSHKRASDSIGELDPSSLMEVDAFGNEVAVELTSAPLQIQTDVNTTDGCRSENERGAGTGAEDTCVCDKQRCKCMGKKYEARVASADRCAIISTCAPVDAVSLYCPYDGKRSHILSSSASVDSMTTPLHLNFEVQNDDATEFLNELYGETAPESDLGKESKF